MTVLHVLIIVGVSIRVIQVPLPVATSLAWLILVFFLPLLGAIAYLVLAEKRLGQKFMTRTRAIKDRYDAWLQNLAAEIRCDPQRLSPPFLLNPFDRKRILFPSGIEIPVRNNRNGYVVYYDVIVQLL